MEGELIATQSPLADTVPDLWRLISDYNCTTIVALNQFDSEVSTCKYPFVKKGESAFILYRQCQCV